MVLETNHSSFHVLNLDDVLFPEKVAELPIPNNCSSMINGDQELYNCIGTNKIIFPIKCIINEHFTKSYLFYFDLSKSNHESLIQKFEFNIFSDLFSIELAMFGDSSYIYTMTDAEIVAIEVTENYEAKIPIHQMAQFSQCSNLTFLVRPHGHWFGVYQRINVHFQRTGFMIESIQDEIQISVVGGDTNWTVNLDQYFTGYRSNVSVSFPPHIKPKGISSPFDYNDPVLLTKEADFVLLGKYDFMGIEKDDLKEKSLVYIKEDLYIYVD